MIGTRRTFKSRVRKASRPGSIELLEGRQLLAVITVNTTADDTTADATLSLREAIEVSDGTLAVSALSTQEQAQVVGTLGSVNTIGFSIPTTDPGFNATTGVWTIAVQSSLPAITTTPAIIDGYTQPGAKSNDLAQGDDAILKIALDGGGGAKGQLVGLTIAASGSRASGLDLENFGGSGVQITALGSVQISGDFIGTDPTGEIPAPNATGVAVDNSFNTIGGQFVADRNVISGNTGVAEGDGIEIPSQGTNPLNVLVTQTQVQNNYIGIDAAGIKAIANGQSGISDFGTGNIYGGTATGLGNVISGNAFGGIKASGGLIFEGNYVGTNAAGTAALGNGTGFGGVTDTAFPATQTILTVITGNLVSGNQDGGIAVAVGDQATSTYTVSNNRIGTNAAGTVALGNGQVGLTLESVHNATVQDNLISGNPVGIQLTGFGTTASHNVFQGNLIGTDINGTANLGNTGNGIQVSDGIGNVFGGGGVGQANVIAFNGGYGIDVESSHAFGSIQDQITQNSIFGNGNAGIHLGAQGTNNFQAAPVLSFTPIGATGTGTLVGALTAAPNTTYTAEIFANPTAPVAGHEQGRTFVGDQTILTDNSGKGSFSVVEPVSIYTDTATDAVGNTSAFSPAAGTPGLTATTTSLSSSLNPSTVGQPVTFTAIVAPSGSAGTPTGTVIFSIGGAAQAPVPLAVVGGLDEATFTSTTLASGSTPIFATYGGDAGFAGSTSNTVAQVVNPPIVPLLTPTTTTLAGTSPSLVGQLATFTAVVAPQSGTGTPTGTVTFTVDGVAQTPVPLAVTGGLDEAAFSTSTLSQGTHTLAATYNGDASFSGSGSNAITQVISPAATLLTPTITLTASPNPATVGQPVRFDVQVSPPAGSPAGLVPTGIVTLGMKVLREEDSIVATGTLDATGHAVFIVSTLLVGTNLLDVGYPGDSNFTSNAYGYLTETILPAGDGPQVVSVQRLGYHAMPTTLVIGFNSPLDPVSAQDVANYRIVGPLSRTESAHRVTSAVYDAATGTVTLHLSKRLNVHRKYQLTVVGSHVGGVTDTSGRLLDGNGDGQPGSDYVTTIDAANLVVTGRMSRGATEALRLAARQRRLDAARHPR